MGGLDIPVLNSLEEILDKSTEMEGVIRWKKYFVRGDCRKENSLQHSYKASLLASIIIDNEEIYSTDFDKYLVLKATVLHDLGEIKTGDTVYIDKTEEGDKREYDFFRHLIKGVPEHVRHKLDLAYGLQNVGKESFSDVTAELGKNHRAEALLFEAIERYGYLVFAYRHYKRDRNEKILVQTLRNQHKRLKWLSDRFQGFGKWFYTMDMHCSIVDFLKQYKGRYIEKKGE